MRWDHVVAVRIVFVAEIVLVVLVTILLARQCRAGTPCPYPVRLIDGRLFDPIAAEAPGFDPSTATPLPWCDADGVPPAFLRRLLKSDADLKDADARCAAAAAEAEVRSDAALAAEKRRADAAAAVALVDIREREAERDACGVSRLECERNHTSRPPRPVRPWYESPWFVAPAAVALTVVVILGAQAMARP